MYASGGGLGSWVAARSDEGVAYRARCDGLARCAVAGVEAALEPDLDEDPCGLGDYGVECLEVECDWLLAERRQTCRSRERQQLPVCRSGGCDHERVDAGRDELLRSRCRRRVQFCREGRGACGIEIGDGDGFDRGER